MGMKLHPEKNLLITETTAVTLTIVSLTLFPTWESHDTKAMELHSTTVLVVQYLVDNY